MKKLILSVVFSLITIIGFCQTLLVQRNSNGLYVSHTVQPKENFYSIGRSYAISPKEIATFNSLDMAAGLSVGQTVLIPLTAANFSQAKSSGTPVYYVVGEKEGLYRVSLKNNNVLMASLRKWNHLATDNISAGQKMIVGYLQGAALNQNATVATTETTTPAITKEPQPVTKTSQQEPKKEEPQQAPPKTTPIETKQPVASKQTVITGGAGYFKPQFDQQSKAHNAGRDATVTSGIFKTTSGWQDAKYYALMDKVEPGTIVQVVNPTNNKSVYAKVLGEMSGIRQNQGLELRISNAAATALDVTEPDKFIVRVLY